MKRYPLLELLKNYSSQDEQQIADRDSIIEFVKKNEDCFERSLSFGHITGSCWLISKDGSKALLTHHKKFNEWLQLGGHCDGDCDVFAVALKEAREESGIMNIKPISEEIFDVGVHLIPKNSKNEEHYHYDVRFLLQVTSDESEIVSDESHALMWIDKNSNGSPSKSVDVIRMCNKWKHLELENKSL